MTILIFLAVNLSLIGIGFLIINKFDNGFGVIPIIITITTLIVSVIAPTGTSTFEIKDAQEFKTDVNITAVADGYPPQLTTDMRFIDKDLIIEKEIKRNFYGLEMTTEYHIQIKK